MFDLQLKNQPIQFDSIYPSINEYQIQINFSHEIKQVKSTVKYELENHTSIKIKRQDISQDRIYFIHLLFEPNNMISSLTRSIQDLPDQVEFQLQIVWLPTQYQVQIQNGLKIYEELLNRQSVQNNEKLFSTEIEKNVKNFIETRLQTLIQNYQQFIKQIQYTLNPDTVAYVNQIFKVLNVDVLLFIVQLLTGNKMGFIEYLQQLIDKCVKITHQKQPAQEYCNQLIKIVIIIDYLSQFLYNDIIIYNDIQSSTNKLILQIFMIFNIVIRPETLDQIYNKWYYRCNKKLFQRQILSFEQILDFCPSEYEKVDFQFKQKLLELSDKKSKFEQTCISNFNQYVFKQPIPDIQVDKILRKLRIPTTMSSRIHSNLLIFSLITDAITNDKLQFSMYSLSTSRNACFSNFPIMKQTLSTKLRYVQKSYNNKYQTLLSLQTVLLDSGFIRSAMEQPLYLKILIKHLMNYCILIQCLLEQQHKLTCPNEFQAQQIMKFYDQVYQKEKDLLMIDSAKIIQKAARHRQQKQFEPDMSDFIKHVKVIQNVVKQQKGRQEFKKMVQQTNVLQQFIRKQRNQKQFLDLCYQIQCVSRIQKNIRLYRIRQKFVILSNQIEDKIITIQQYIQKNRAYNTLSKTLTCYMTNQVNAAIKIQKAYREHKLWKEEKQRIIMNATLKARERSNLLSAQFNVLQQTILRIKNVITCYYHFEKLYIICYLDSDYVQGLSKELILALNSAVFQCSNPVQFKTLLGFLNLVIEKKGVSFMKQVNKSLEPSKVEVLKSRRCYFDKYLIKQIKIYDQSMQKQKLKDPLFFRELKKFYKFIDQKQ